MWRGWLVEHGEAQHSAEAEASFGFDFMLIEFGSRSDFGLREPLG